MDPSMRTLAAVLITLACASREIPAPVPVAVRTEVAQSRALVAPSCQSGRCTARIESMN